MTIFPAAAVNGPTSTLLILGSIFLLGVLADLLSGWIRIPRISFLLLVGLALGPLGFNVISPSGQHQWLSVSADIALVMVGFLLGGHFTRSAVREHGRLVLRFSIAITVVSVISVFGGLLLFGAPVEVAILLAGIATATDPAAVADVIKESRSKGLFTQTLIGVVAIDDALGLIAFSVLLATAHALQGGAGWGYALIGLWEIGGAVLIGGGLGFFMARTLAFLHADDCPRHKERVFMETLGFVLLCGGVAMYCKVSFLLSSMTLGVVVVNALPRACAQVFYAIEKIVWPFLTLFFVFAGASLQPESLPQIGWIGFGYLLFRIVGRIVGGWVGGSGVGVNPAIRRWMGVALLPQASVALGMALIVAQQFPGLRDTVLPIVIGSTVLFQIIGPMLTRLALFRVQETEVFLVKKK